MIQNKMLSRFWKFVIFFVVLLICAGAGVGIYFLRKKYPDPPCPTGAVCSNITLDTSLGGGIGNVFTFFARDTNGTPPQYAKVQDPDGPSFEPVGTNELSLLFSYTDLVADHDVDIYVGYTTVANKTYFVDDKVVIKANSAGLNFDTDFMDVILDSGDIAVSPAFKLVTNQTENIKFNAKLQTTFRAI